MEQNLRPARIVPPGRILRQELEARGWTQRDLAAIIGRPEQMVSEMINGLKQITPETSLELAQTFGVSPEFWYTLEANYRLEIARREERDDSISRRSRLYDALPMNEMARRGWIKLSESVDTLETGLSGFLGIDLSSSVESVTAAAHFRCSTSRGPATYAQLAWLRRAELLARQQVVSPWRSSNIAPLVAELMTLSASAQEVTQVPQVLARWGVRCVILPHLSKTYLDGAQLYIDEVPCVALTLRYDRIDSFWFTLMHEIGHLSEGGRESYLDILESNHEGDVAQAAQEEPDPHEVLANRRASEWLIEPAAFQDYVSANQTLFSRASIEAFADSQNRHPGIVLGRLQRDGLVPWRNLRGLLVKVSPYLKEFIQN